MKALGLAWGPVEPAPRLALLVNPDSGSGDAELVETALRSFGNDVTVFEAGGDEAAATEAVHRALGAGATRMVVAGGDGSIASAAAAAGKASIPLAVVPVGTANDFARAHGLPDDIDAACRVAACGGETRPHDLARVGECPFLNVASAGLPPVAAREAKGLKGLLGSLAYPIGAVRAGLKAAPLDCVVSCDGREVHRGGAWQVTVACTGAFGGGAEIDADPHDGVLDVIVIPSGSRATLIWRAFGLRRGAIDRQRKVGAHRCRQTTLEAPTGTELNVDGEIVATDSARFTIEPHGFELVIG